MSDAPLSTDLTSRRLLSLDTLRGFDMFWIIGGDALFRKLAEVTDWRWADVVAGQLTHVKWEGLRAYDMIFPLFMFIAGVAIPYAFASRRQSGASRRDLQMKVFSRAVTLVLLGLICNRVLDFDFANFRVASVLGQIGLAYLFASLIVLYAGSFWARFMWLVGILVGYAAVQLFVPVPGVGAGVLTQEGIINGYIDRMLLPGRLYGKVDGVQMFDPEGLLCIVSATGITLMGTLAGSVLRDGNGGGTRKAALLAVAGMVSLGIGVAIAPWYPPIKAAWTTTFNLQAGGISLMLLAAFYLVIDVWQISRWTFFFRVIGLNAITIYMAPRIIDFSHASDFLLGGIAPLVGIYSALILIAGSIGLKWLFLWFLYRHKIFLRV
jgi:predicted acyltransferase